MKTAWSMVATLTTVGALGAMVACSSAGASGDPGNGGGAYGSCLSSLLGGTCISCLQAHCGGAVGGLQTGCGDYLDCICPGGNFSAPNAQSATCGAKLEESSCVSTASDGGAFACAACDSACSLTGGSNMLAPFDASSGFNPPPSGSSGGCASSPSLPATMAVTLSLAGVDFGDASTSPWQGIGYNLDGECTTAASTNVCVLAAGASLSTQDDGANGIDNSYGENLCPMFETLTGPNACSTDIQKAYLQTDGTGTGTLVVGTMVYPVRDVHIALAGSSGGGMAGGVIPTAGLTAAWTNASACISTALCSGTALQSIVTRLTAASDIGADGSNAAGTACDGVSFGIKFTGSTPVTSVPAPPSCSCTAGN